MILIVYSWHPYTSNQNRSPEEYEDDAPLTEKIDVYSLGNLLWDILAGKDEVFGDYHTEEAVKMIQDGDFDLFLEDEEEHFDEKEEAILKAIRMCHIYDAKERSTAMEVEEYLLGKLESFGISEY